MTEPIEHRIPSAAGRASVRLVQLPPAALSALLDGDLTSASAKAGVALTDFFLADEALWLWRLRLDQIAADPGSARWVARAAVAEPEGAVVGYAVFHGPPDAAGMVEVGYSVAPDRRRRGHARAILAELLRWAGAESGVRTVRASIRPTTPRRWPRFRASASSRSASSGTTWTAGSCSSSAPNRTDRPGCSEQVLS